MPGYIAQTHNLSPLANKTANYTFTLIGENQGAPLTDDQIVRALIAQKEDMIKEVSTPYGYKMILIEPDTYSMGLAQNYPERQFNETQVRMRIRQPFYMGLHEVSNGEYKRFKADHDSGIVKGVSLQSGDRPVVGISWREAVEYCNWLSGVQGLEPAYQEIDGNFSLIEPRTDGYRLPTEAEWEYVARYNSGTTNLVYPWGIEMPPLSKSGNFAGEEAKVMISQSIRGYRDGYRATAPRGSFSANSLGIFDLGGNVAEWTLTDPRRRIGIGRTDVTIHERRRLLVVGGTYLLNEMSQRWTGVQVRVPSSDIHAVGVRLARTLEKRSPTKD